MIESQSGPSPWSPLSYPVFRSLWIATLASNIGTWMQNVGAAWLMTSLSKAPLMVALVQAATLLPMFVLALPAGALADLVDRRRLLLVTQTWMLVAAAVLWVLTFLDRTTPWMLLGLTFLLGLGAGMNGPAWQAIVPELVPRRELLPAISLNSAGFNLSRAVGPAVGGAIVAASGAGATFLLNAVSFLGVIIVLYRWPRPPMSAALPAERMLAAMRSGLRYIRHAPVLRAVLLRLGIFMACSSVLWALLPFIARYELGGGPTVFGILQGCMGAGAVAGALILPGLARVLSGEWLAPAATLAFAAVTLILAFVPVMAVVAAALLVAGAAWLVLLSTLNAAVQTAVPSWVRARALAVYMLVFAGSMSAGSALWGAVATHRGISQTLILSALGLILGFLLMLLSRVKLGQDLDMTPSLHWGEPLVVLEPHPEHGPILVMIEHRIDPKDSEAFSQAMQALRLIRRRDGAIRWGLFQDLAEPGRFIETFIVETWAEHLRQHERMTMADREVEERVRAFHLGGSRPAVSHFIYAYGARVPRRLKIFTKFKKVREKDSGGNSE
jgi:MFS family permease/quinol monooxygenase YgiN